MREKNKRTTFSFQLIQGNGGLKRLMQFIQDSSVPAVQAAAAKAIGRAARKRNERKRKAEVSLLIFSAIDTFR